MSSSFSTGLRPGHRTMAQLATGLFGLVAVGIVVVNAVWLAFAEDRSDRWMFVGVGTFVALLAGWFYRWLRRYQDYRLWLDEHEVCVVSDGTTHRWSWEQVTGMAIVTGSYTSSLTVEDERAPQADLTRPRVSGAYRTLLKRSPLAVTIPLWGLDASEEAIVQAIREFSGGRFPDARRSTYRVFSRG